MLGIAFNRTRLAPTPSGYLHGGNLFSFLLTYKLAQATHAKVVLRIDDLDAPRVDENYVKDIFEVLTTFSLAWQEGPMNYEEVKLHSQQTRLEHYRKNLQLLVDKDLVYACNCSRQQVYERTGSANYDGHCREKAIALTTPNVAWRLKCDKGQSINLRNEEGLVTTHLLPESVFDFIVLRRDGIPSYQFASYCDDVYYDIDFIVRGEDLFDSTLAQLYFAKQLGNQKFEQARFLHHPLLRDRNGNKLSKSENADSIKAMLNNGFTAQQIILSLTDKLPKKYADIILHYEF
jgi:glutamyl/glutaminyl-tRNA synthetase